MKWVRTLAKSAGLFMVLVCLSWGVSEARAEQLAGTGEWQSSSGGAMRGTWGTTLARSGSELRGTMMLTGSPLFSGSEVTGKMDGEEIVLGVVTEGDNEVSFRGKLANGTVAGEWNCPAINDWGTWTGTLRLATDQ
jgi:hypothetical protein